MSLFHGAWFADPHAQKTADTRPATPAAALGQWREAPAYLSLFVPRLYRQSYRAFTSTMALDAAARLAASAGDDGEAPPGAWIPREENPLDAFGQGGTYDRWRVVRLYGSRRPRVARGPRHRRGLVDESWTMISPYPSADLTRLEPGTLLIILRVP
jgi:hypothetical protein